LLTGDIIVTEHDSYAIVKISRPEKMNSVTKAMLESFDENVSKIANEPSIRAIIFTGEGHTAFSAGFDLKTIQGLKGQEATDFFKLLERTIRGIRENRTCITIAAINGYAIGFGAMVALACDFRIFSDEAVFRLPEVELSVFPGAGACSNLLQLVGPARTKDILLTARKVSAKEAMQIGLADMIINKDEIMEKSVEFVQELLKKNPKILIRTKTLIDGMTGKELSEAEELETVYLDEWLREM
jgi:enoyl-CoA hydratase/carnithine racemase